MSKTKLPAHVVLILLLLTAPLAGVQCSETGDFIRGTESRSLATLILNELSVGVVDAVVCSTVGLAFGLSEDVTQSEICGVPVDQAASP